MGINGDMPARNPVGLALLKERCVLEPSGCWSWLGVQPGTKGYVSIRVGSGPKVKAHRYVYEILVGKIPEGLQLDHLCRNPSCINPEHLEPVTNRENTMRGTLYNLNKTHCPKGHEYTEDNTRIDLRKDGRPFRSCRACHRLREAVRRNNKVGV